MTNAAEPRCRRDANSTGCRNQPGRRYRPRLAVVAPAIGLVLLGLATGPAQADRAGKGYKHADETATTYRHHDDAIVAFFCDHQEEATKAAVDGVAEIYHQLTIGNCHDARPAGLDVTLKEFKSGPYWFGDDTIPWSVWSVIRSKGKDKGSVIYALVPDTTGKHEPVGKTAQ